MLILLPTSFEEEPISLVHCLVPDVMNFSIYKSQPPAFVTLFKFPLVFPVVKRLPVESDLIP